ncbi:unnamed protein product [Trichogramma brassicae]|uniref:Uncharacterized protein n=1 Tax=Trichogramma brassicae TaxID=86971 RepID=A0A6H5J3N6_9HYME|nr:unnamed protein product [Trichogramma brassicae]
MSTQEAAYHTLSLPLCYSSRSSIYINTAPKNDRTRILKNKKDLQKLPPDSKNIYKSNIFEKYEKRKNCLEDIQGDQRTSNCFLSKYLKNTGVGSIPTRRIFEVRFFAWCGRACARGGAGTTQKEDPGYVISLRSGKKTPITVRAGSDRITISRSPRRGLTKLAIDGAQHSHDEVRSENHTHKRAPDAGAKAQLERMMAPEARTTLTR